MRLEGKTAVIIGGGQAPGLSAAIGNGRATALLFAREGAKVCCVDRNLESAQQTADQITGNGGTATARAADVTDETALESAIRGSAEEWGRLDILHNNVGISVEGGDAPLEAVSTDAFERIFDINLLGTMFACKHALPIMQAQKSEAAEIRGDCQHFLRLGLLDGSPHRALSSLENGDGEFHAANRHSKRRCGRSGQYHPTGPDGHADGSRPSRRGDRPYPRRYRSGTRRQGPAS